MVFKIALACAVFVALSGLAHSEVTKHTLPSEPIQRDLEERARAVLKDTNLPRGEAYDILDIIEAAYDHNPNNNSGLVSEIQANVQKLYPRLKNNVFLNYAAAIYYSEYMLVAEVGRDTILVYGL